MTDTVIFLNSAHLWPILLGALVLLAILVLKEWLQQGRRGLAVKTAVALLAVAALICIALKPAIRQTLEGGKAILLTQGYHGQQLDSLARRYRGIRRFRYEPGKPVNLPTSVQSVFVLGYGLEPYDLWQLEGRACTFLPADRPTGVTALRHHTALVLGETLRVGGNYLGPVPGGRLLLRDPGGNPADSVNFREAAEQPFALEAAPKAAGNFTFRLEEQDSSGTVLRSDPVPVQVTSPQPVRVLILNTFPTFETRYLKNFLAEKGNEVLVRSQLTRGAYKFEYFNLEEEPVYGLTEQNLDRFDLVITDTDSYLRLNNSSRSALRRQMESAGLGLLIQPDEQYFGLLRNQTFFGFRADSRTEFRLGPGNGPEVEKYAYDVVPDFPVQPVALPGGNRIGAYRPVGNGRAVATFLRNTYQLELDGDKEAYQAVWSALISAGVRGEAGVRWEARSLIPRKDEPFAFRLYTGPEAPRVSNDMGMALPLRQDALLPSRWEGTDFPREEGWNRLQVATDSAGSTAYYVFGETDWEALRRNRTLEANLQFSAGSEPPAQKATHYAPIAPIWFYALFLLSMGWLWLEPRLAGRY